MMPRHTLPLVFALVCGYMGSASADPTQERQRAIQGRALTQGGRDAFMPLPSVTPADLARRLSADPMLLNAYAKHFGVDAKRIPAFVKDALVLRPLSKAQAVVTYGRNPTGLVYPVRQVLPKGSYVWMTRDGKAWLKWKCTNPLGRKLPIMPMPPREGYGSQEFQLDISRPAGALSTLPESQSASTVLSLPEPGEPPMLLDSPYKPAPYNILPLGLAPIPETTSRRNISPWLWAVGATLPRGHRTTTMIPEPSSVALLVLGGLGLLPFLLQRKSKH